MHRFQTPPVVHELNGHPVQQFGMRRGLALPAQVFTRTNQPDAKVGLPDAIHLGAGSRRRLTIHEPIGKRKPVGRRIFRKRIQESRDAGWQSAGRLDIELTRPEAARGGQVEIWVTMEHPCPMCGGVGGRIRVCPNCRGSGLISAEVPLVVGYPPGLKSLHQVHVPVRGLAGPGKWLTVRFFVSEH